MNPDGAESQEPNRHNKIRNNPSRVKFALLCRGVITQDPIPHGEQPSDSSPIIESFLALYRLSRMSTDLIVRYFQRITNPYSTWASYRFRQVRFPPRQTVIQRTLFSKLKPVRTKARRFMNTRTICHHHRRKEIIPVISVLPRKHSQHHQ